MVQMRMGKHDRGYGRRLHRQRRPIAQAQCLEALKQPAIDQDAVATPFQKIFGPGDRTGSAEKCKLERHDDLA